MGATLAHGGATFRVWAPGARKVYLLAGEETEAARQPGWAPQEDDALAALGDGTWAGFVPGARDGTPYRFWMVGEGRAGFKRDPFARELGTVPGFPDCDCLVRDPASYPWQDEGFRPPGFHDLVIYQFHFGVFYAVDAAGRDAREQRRGKFLDLLDRIDYLRDLGINAVLTLPIQEYPSQFSRGYNGTDYFSPESDYQVEDEGELERYLAKANSMLARHDRGPLTLDQLRPGPNQLKAVVDLCHLNGIAVLLDLVYNHAGGGFDPASLYFFDLQPGADQEPPDFRRSLYFAFPEPSGGLTFDYTKAPVRQFLIDNARFFLDEYRVDGFRYDEVSTADRFGGWFFCQDLAATVRFHRPQAIQIAEYWNDWRWLAVVQPPEGMGFDAALADGLRIAVRHALEQASAGAHAAVDLHRVRDALHRPHNFPAAWKAVQSVEDHDIVFSGRERRIASLADPGNPRSWHARSRARLAIALVLTAPGIPMIFMGQEILEDKPWNDNPEAFRGSLLWWEGLETDRAMRDHLRFTRDLIGLRRRLPALRSESIHVFHVHDGNRVIAFHRWLEGEGRDIVVVASLNESSFGRYDLGFPGPGRWEEAFNSDFYDHFPNPQVAGNGGGVIADGQPLHGFGQSASVTIPANGVIVFFRA